jgi:hypothetical protein
MALPVSFILSAAGAVILYNILNRYRSFARHYAEAKRSGLPIVVMPWNVHSIFWLATNAIWLPLLRLLPEFCHGLWIE